MASHIEVVRYLRPDGGYVARGEDYEGIEFIDAEPFTEAEYKKAFALVDAAKEKAAEDAAKARLAAEAKLAVLGLNVDDLKALGLA